MPTADAFAARPDFSRYEFVKGYDFIAHDPYPNDHNGHGTFVAGTIAESTNNRFGLTGLAYGVRVMPVRVLNNQGEGDASTIAEGVRFAVNHGAQVINLSLEFASEVTASDIPELLEALRYARRRGVVVVAAAGNEGHTTIAYPARAPDVIAVGATTEHGCLANYSNDGTGLTLVAPGGGADAEPPRRPQLPPRRTLRPRRLPDDLHRVLAPALRVPERLRRHFDGLTARGGNGGFDHRFRGIGEASVAGAGDRAAAGHSATAGGAFGLAAVWGRARQRSGCHGAGRTGGR